MRDLLDAAVAEGLVSAPLVVRAGACARSPTAGSSAGRPGRAGSCRRRGPSTARCCSTASRCRRRPRSCGSSPPTPRTSTRWRGTSTRPSSHALDPPSGDLTENVGEVLAAVRGRPFHPTARAVSGWAADDLARWGPGRTVAVDAVAVRSDHLRLGTGGFPELIDAPDGYRVLPVHPFDREHVLPVAFAAEIADGIVVPLDRGVGEGRVTSSLRTLDLGGGRHLKLPLGVTTLGSTRLLGARSLDFAQRGERVLRDVLAADPGLAARVAVADETAWAGFARPDGSDEFDDRPGHLAAALRVLPPPTGSHRVPLGALGRARLGRAARGARRPGGGVRGGRGRRRRGRDRVPAPRRAARDARAERAAGPGRRLDGPGPARPRRRARPPRPGSRCPGRATGSRPAARSRWCSTPRRS